MLLSLTKQNEPLFLNRLIKINANAHPQWGKLSATEMLVHCRKGLEVPMSHLILKPNIFIKLLFADHIKKSILSEDKFNPNLPTAKEFITFEKDMDFNSEKTKLVETIQAFVEYSDEKLAGFTHPIYKNISAAEWRFAIGKHLCHHFDQFSI